MFNFILFRVGYVVETSHQIGRKMLPQTLVDNRYSILSLLGRGGMGHVYLAHDEILGRDVALKMLKEAYTDDKLFVERFRREARNAAALSHPNIVPVYDGGNAEDGAPYIAMEYMAGGTLAEYIEREGKLGTPEATAITLQIARALREAHHRGVVHRDVKPHNIFLAEYPASSSAVPEGVSLGAVKVGDFGIARAAEASTMTESNLILGTPRYLSPEQAKGDPVGPKSDLYSLGVLLYQMLTGRVPFDDEDPIAITMKHVSEPPASPKETNPEIAEEMNALVLRLLSKEPEDRHENAKELIRELNQVRTRFSTSLTAANPTGAEVHDGSGETKEAAPQILTERNSKLRPPWKHKAGITSAAVVYSRNQKRRQISLWLLAAASIVVLAALLGTVGQHLLQDYATQASLSSPQDPTQESGDAPGSVATGKTDSAADGGDGADGKAANALPVVSPSQSKASSYNVSPGEPAKQSSGAEGAVAVPTNLVTRGSGVSAPPEPVALQATPTPGASPPKSSSTRSSQHLVVTANMQKSIKLGGA
jgi:serine/threonine protein kinase